MSKGTTTIGQSASIIAAIALASKKDIPIEEVMTDKRKRSVLITDGSITRLLGDLIISPIIRISSDLKMNEYIEDAIKTNMDFFVSFYSKAFTRLVKDKGFETDDALRLLSSKQSRTIGDVSNYIGESMVPELDFLPIADTIVATYNGEGEDDLNEHRALFVREVGLSISFTDKRGDKNVTKTIRQNIVVRAIVEYVQPQKILHLLKVENKLDKSLFVNWHKYRSGENSLADLILGSKLIEEERKGRLADDDDLIKELHDRTDDANRMLITDGVVGFGKYYLMLIISDTMKVQIANAVKDKISTPRGKDLLLNTLKAMSVSIMDERYEKMTVYFESLPGSSTISYKKLKKKDKDDDIKDILKLFATRM